jgi:hypothetical protein
VPAQAVIGGDRMQGPRPSTQLHQDRRGMDYRRLRLPPAGGTTSSVHHQAQVSRRCSRPRHIVGPSASQSAALTLC